MTDKQPKALMLAEAVIKHLGGNTANQAAAELRRLHEVNAELVEALKRMKLERGFTCDCGIEDKTWDLIDKYIGENND